MSKKVLIEAKDTKEALVKGAKMFNVSRDEFKKNAHIVKSDDRSFEITYAVSMATSSLPDTDDLLDKLESEITDIETDEIISGLTSEEMYEKGLIGDSPIPIPKPAKPKQSTEKGYTFPEGIDYYSCELYQKIEDVPYDEIEHVEDVLPNQIVAFKISTVIYAKAEDFKLTLFHSESYIKICNLKISYSNKKVSYTSLKKGKVVLLKGLVYLIPSDRDSYFHIRIAPNKMFVEIDFYPSKGEGKKLSAGLIRSELIGQKILFGIKDDVIKENVALAQQSGESLKNVIIAEGLEPVDGAESTVSLNFSKESIIDNFKVLPDGRVDYRKQARIQIVKKGDLLATITEPEKGIDGKNIFAKKITAKDGDKKVLYPGTNVEKSKDGLQFFATSDGQPVLNKNILNVFAHYHVPGDVDYSTGNIEFEGNVTIKGNVLPGFEVKATGDVLVMGSIDNGIIDAGRDIKVHGGIIGNNENIIKCGRNLTSQHLQNAYLEVQGDVIIRDSVLHSKIYSTGNVILREGKGVIVGGLVHAMRSVEAKIIGSKTGTKSKIIVGQDFLIQKMCNEFITAQEFCKNNIEKIEKFLKPLLQLIKNGTPISDEKKQRFALIIQKHKELTNHYSMMEAKIKELQKSAESHEKAVIKVRNTIYSDVTITIKSISTLIKNEATFTYFQIDPEKNKIVRNSFKKDE